MYFYYSICGLDIQIVCSLFPKNSKKRHFSLLLGPKMTSAGHPRSYLWIMGFVLAFLSLRYLWWFWMMGGFFHTEWNSWLGSLVLHSAGDPLSTSSPTWPLTCPNDSTMLTTGALIKFIFWWIDSGWLWGNIICVIVMLFFFSSHSHPFSFLYRCLISCFALDLLHFDVCFS